MLIDLVNIPSSEQIQVVHCVKRILVGAGPLTPSLYAACQRLFPKATFVTAYGMTEACSSITFRTLPAVWPLSAALQVQRGFCVGKPPPGIEICIHGEADEGAPNNKHQVQLRMFLNRFVSKHATLLTTPGNVR